MSRSHARLVPTPEVHGAFKATAKNYYVNLCMQCEKKNVTTLQYVPCTYLSMLVIPEPRLSRNVRQAPWM
jgi:inosine-uridine nucleoside N-ribohydrolase